jgi:hypothetical protein
MTWLDGVAYVVIFAALFCVVYLYARRPAFWVELSGRVIVALRPYILASLSAVIAYVTNRNTPEVEAQMAECVRRGGRWDNFRKKCVENK